MNIRRLRLACSLLGIVLLTSPSVSYEETAPRATVTPASVEQARQLAPLFMILQEYFTALAQGDVEKLALYHPALTVSQRDILREYFAHTVRDLHIDLRDVQVQLASPDALEYDRVRAPIPALGGIARVYVVPNISITGEVTGFKIPDSIDDRYKAHYVDVDIYFGKCHAEGDRYAATRGIEPFRWTVGPRCRRTSARR